MVELVLFVLYIVPTLVLALILGPIFGFLSLTIALFFIGVNSIAFIKQVISPAPETQGTLSKNQVVNKCICGRKYPQDIIICTNCGCYKDLYKNCPNCGEIIAIRTLKCPNCKVNLDLFEYRIIQDRG